MVCVLFEGGEHGKLAARLATQVIKAYVDKQRQQPTKMVQATDSKVEIGSLWSEAAPHGDGQELQAGKFLVTLPKKPVPLATAAPGLDAVN